MRAPIEPHPATTRILIVGGGAMGGIFAARLAATAEVTIFDIWREHTAAISREGLRLHVRTDAATQSLIAWPAAVSTPDALAGPTFTHALIAVKGPHTREAVRRVRDHLSGAIVLTVQNGLGNTEVIASECRASVCCGVTMNAGEATAPGEITQREIGGTWLGPHRATLEDARRWGDVLARAGMAVEVLADPRGAIWGKLIFNAAVNPLPVLTGMPLSGVYAQPDAYALLRTLVDEGRAVAAALGIALHTDPMAVIDAHRALGDAHAHVGSMKQDVDRGRPTEIDTLTGAIVAEGDRLGIPVPASRTVYRLVKAAEARAAAAAGGER
ncbi:MAG TPA: 2-dehydropantoate 2-reductase [bacterium]|nr:2-dehydropantoate 2-reductase [bacterium]